MKKKLLIVVMVLLVLAFAVPAFAGNAGFTDRQSQDNNIVPCQGITNGTCTLNGGGSTGCELRGTGCELRGTGCGGGCELRSGPELPQI